MKKAIDKGYEQLVRNGQDKETAHSQHVLRLEHAVRARRCPRIAANQRPVAETGEVVVLQRTIRQRLVNLRIRASKSKYEQAWGAKTAR